MTLSEIRELVTRDMEQVNHLIEKQVDSDVALIKQLGFYIVNSGGKRLRPLLTVLASRALGIESRHHYSLAAIIEFIHTATLLHDDVVDASELRRGKETANAVFGNQASVLVGDFLYSRAFQMMTSLNSMTVMNILADATNRIAQGEVMQLMNLNDPDTTEERYMDVIYSKTARLFEAATQLSAVITSQPSEIEKAMQDYGRYVGTAFQLIDDVLDYSADESDMGKQVGDDLAEGKPTLPLLHAMWNADEKTASMIRSSIENADGMQHFDLIFSAMQTCGSLQYTVDIAIAEAEKAKQAIAILPNTKYKDALLSLADISVHRKA
ncbi:MAG: octaprenyl diphosphate synthase [Pseudomonadota bacterium]